MKNKNPEQITSSSVSSYFLKNLHQLGFTPTKSLTMSCKELIENSIDALREHQIENPKINLVVERIGEGPTKNTDLVKIRVDDNGPGIEEDIIGGALGSMITSSRFGRNKTTLGAQGIGSTAILLYSLATTGKPAIFITKTEKMKEALSGNLEIDVKFNKGNITNKKYIEWDRNHGLLAEYVIECKPQINGESGLLTYLNSIALVHPFISFNFKIFDLEPIKIDRIVKEMPPIPEATYPHPHTMKLGEFIAHSHLFPESTVTKWLKTNFSRVYDSTIQDLKKSGISSAVLNKKVSSLTDEENKLLYSKIQSLTLLPPSTKSVISLGEETLSKSILKVGEIDFFSVVTRKPTVVDMRPVQIEVAIARLKEKHGLQNEPIKVLRFANFSPLIYDKSACVTTESIKSVNFKPYGLEQPKDGLPLGPYIIVVSIVSPGLKFVNASKTALDSGTELLAEIRLALIQAGQRLAKYIKQEKKAEDLEKKRQYIEQFCPILISSLCRIAEASDSSKKKAEAGLRKILGRDTSEAKEELEKAEEDLEKHKEKTEQKK